jgi:hypothetical protein
MAKIQEDGTLTIERIIPDAGPVPYVADMDGDFVDRRMLRKCVLDRMRLVGAAFYAECVGLPTDEQLKCQAYFAHTVGDVPEEAVWCAGYVGEHLYVYLLNMSPESGCVVENYILHLPTYTETGMRETKAYWKTQWHGDMINA